MPIYNVVPTKDQWKKDLGLSIVFGNLKSPFPAMERLGKLIADYHEVPGRTYTKKLGQLHLVYLMYRDCQFIVKNNQKGSDYANKKMGGQLNTSQFNAVFALETYLERNLTAFLGCERWEFNSQLMTTFGRGVTDGSQKDDKKLLDVEMIDWYQSDVARQMYKLSFRAGLALKWDYQGEGKGRLRVYDTAARGDAWEYGGSLYVMDQRGRIYVNGIEVTNLKHSSFMAGQAVQCAGTIRFERGQLAWLSGKSGHYQPTVTQIVNMLEKLRSYQVNLNRVIVYRENKRQDFPNSPNLDFEPCGALALLARRAWPTGVEPQSMHVL
ncbi:MAG TPA: hypothetical protein VFC39_14950 [Acidobacteriaceae bacterium]|nr:hypothetical protein [Acidobacteriaceae bacterium]